MDFASLSNHPQRVVFFCIKLILTYMINTLLTCVTNALHNVARKRGPLPSIKRLDKMYALALCDLEIAQATRVVYYPEDPEEKKLVDYCMSTINRRVFSILCIKATLDNEGLLPRDAVQKLGTTRATVDTMIKEMEDAGWIEVKRDESCYRTLFATEILSKSYTDYSRALADYSLKLDFGGINKARRYAE